MRKIEEKALKLLEQCQEFVLCSVDENGYPRACVVSKLKHEGYTTLCCATGMSGVKTRHFQKNPKASVCYHNEQDSVTLVGSVCLVTDAQERAGLWQDWMYPHFPEGIDDPEYCPLRFTAKEATLWIEGEFVTLTDL